VNEIHGGERIFALKVLRSALESVANLQCDFQPDGDADARIARAGCPTIRICLRPWSAHGTLGMDEVWVLRTASAARQQRLRERGENFIALNGAVRLVDDWLVLDRTGLPSARAGATLARRTDPFSDRNSLIARTLLAHPHRTWGVRELAGHAGVSLGTASQVIRALAGIGAIEQKLHGRAADIRLTDPERLLRPWFTAYSWKRNAAATFNAPVGDVSRFLRRLPKLLGETRWALTLQAGAAQVAPHATWDRVHVYADVEHVVDLLRIGEDHGWEHSEDGRVVLMKPYYKTSVWHELQTLHQLPVVSTLQLALDLWHYPLRGREQAEHLLNLALKDHG
jgi:hypothetical protein